MQGNILAKVLPIIVIIVFATFAGRGLLHSGLPPTHDGEYHVIRFYEFDKVLREGNLYPRWAPDLNRGYGVPLFNYVYPFPNYIASLIHAMGIHFIDAFKLSVFTALLLSSLFMYFWAKIFWGEWGGIVSSVFYTYAPYHFLDIYIRGSVGEVWALGFFPAFLWAVTKFIREKKDLFLPIAALFLAVIIFSHNILALMFFPLALSYMVFLLVWQKEKRLWGTSLAVVLLGLSLSSVFWLPALWEGEFVRGLEIFDYKRHFVEIYQLIFPSWGSGFSADATTEGLSFQIGVANLLIITLLTITILFRRKIKEAKLVLFFLAWTAFAIFLMLPISKFLWDGISLMQYFQFPWRFLSLVILSTAFLAGSLGKSKVIMVFFIVLAFGAGIIYTTPAYYHMRDDNYYITRPNFIEGTNSPGNAFNTRWFNESLQKATQRIEEQEDKIKVNIAYFPGWQVFVDGKKVETGVDKDGLIVAKRPETGGTIEVKFLNTHVRSMAIGISLVSFGLLLFLLLQNVRVRMEKKP